MKPGALLNTIVGMPVSHVWFSDYSVFYMELGELTPNTERRRDGSFMNPRGEVSVYAGFDWRIERAQSIWCGRHDSRKRRESVIGSLVGTVLTEATVSSRISELSIGFSNGLWLATFDMSKGGPEWHIGFQGNGYLDTCRGRLRHLGDPD
ncbi:MAG: hypothetical protein EOP87_21710 [Verrucomicrobiaceae bacterium]|nr:MAG: hypothetical protein EOP87_21710 [Verrucomicrobiaceae bacterium]